MKQFDLEKCLEFVYLKSYGTPHLFALGERERAESVSMTLGKSERSNKTDGWKRSDSLRSKCDLQTWRNVRMFRRQRNWKTINLVR